MEKIFHKKELLGVHVKKMLPGSSPILDAGEPLQLLTLKHPKGAQVKAHTHTPTERITTHLQECLVVVRGALQIALYGSETKPVQEVLVGAGEAFVFISGGHSVTFLEDSEVFEIKNGPFTEDRVALL